MIHAASILTDTGGQEHPASIAASGRPWVSRRAGVHQLGHVEIGRALPTASGTVMTHGCVSRAEIVEALGTSQNDPRPQRQCLRRRVHACSCWRSASVNFNSALGRPRIISPYRHRNYTCDHGGAN